MIGRRDKLRMGSRLGAVLLAACLAVGGAVVAQSPQQTGPKDQQKPAPKAPAETNPFPEDTNSVPVLPNGESAATPAPTYAAAPPAMPSDDADPVRSPDDPVPDNPSSSQWSDSASGVPMDSIAPPPDENIGKKHRKGDDQFEEPVHKETAKEDESVGGLYLDQHDWRGALSRYESAVVLDPENPDVYWGLAEAQRNLGQFASAKANYLKVMEYDPDSKHAKEARKRLKEPALANATTPPAPQR